ncbi:MAG: hypothetical protein R3E41_13490 [Burkholderiaceae bacterium]
MNTIASDHDDSGLRDAFRVAVAGIVALWVSIYLFPDGATPPEPAPDLMALPVVP